MAWATPEIPNAETMAWGARPPFRVKSLVLSFLIGTNVNAARYL